MSLTTEATRAKSADPITTDLFGFESDFAATLRCVPMVVRFKLDQCGVKLSLRQWAGFSLPTKRWLAQSSTETRAGISQYREYVCAAIRNEMNEEPALLDAAGVVVAPDAATIPDAVMARTRELRVAAPDRERWGQLSPLQRFAIVKLTRANHENANFLPAMREFGLLVE